MDTVIVKVGGSLSSYPERLRSLCAKLTELSQTNRLILVPGGGEFADTVRNLDKRFGLSSAVSHRMAILGMDQYGLLLSNLLPKSSIVNRLEMVQGVLSLGKLPVFLPSTLLFAEDPLENSWSVTSDSIAAYIAGRLGLKKLVLITDVDGILTDDPKSCPNAKLMPILSSSEILRMHKRTSVDSFLPNLLMQSRIECFVVNGLYPERVQAVLENQETVCTLITDNWKTDPQSSKGNSV